MDPTEEGAVAIVTGAATGIGSCCAAALARSGFRVTVNYNSSRDAAEQTAANCAAEGPGAMTVQGDVSDDTACRSIVRETVTAWGRVDVLVNNAGVTRFAEASNLDALSKRDFLDIMAVNVVGAYQMTRAARPFLARSDIASVINVSSHSGFTGTGSSIAYAASKGALNTLTSGLALALAPEIRVNAVCPGFVDTDWMRRKLDGEALDAFKNKVAAIAPLGRVVSPDEVAEAVCWFATGGRSTTGQLLVIDGGTHMTIGSPI